MARFARATGWTMAEVRAASYRDMHAMALVFAEEEVARKRAAAKKGRR